MVKEIMLLSYYERTMILRHSYMFEVAIVVTLVSQPEQQTQKE